VALETARAHGARAFTGKGVELTDTVFAGRDVQKSEFPLGVIMPPSQEKVREWSNFKSWLSSSDRAFDTVIDGANVGHCCQGQFSLDAVDAVCKRAGALAGGPHW